MSSKNTLPPQDNCMISKTQYSNNEQKLRAKLYNISQKRAKEALEKEREEDSKFEINPDTFQRLTDNNSIINEARSYQAKLASHADEKMSQFIDDMRTEFSNTSGKYSIPQHILYQQTRMQQQQVQLLEKNQNALVEVLNRTLNNTGNNSEFALKQEMNNYNRSMMQDIIAPLNQRFVEMKNLYENTKA